MWVSVLSTLMFILISHIEANMEGSILPGDSFGLPSAAFLQTVLEDINYDNRIYPGSDKQRTTVVTVHMVVDSIDSVDESSMDFTINLMITQEWYDRRLKFHGLTGIVKMELDSRMITSVWVPDLYFANAKKATFHDVTVPNVMMHLNHNGTVRYKSRVSLKASCAMKLNKFPMDDQLCSLPMKSFAYTKQLVRFKWRKDNAVVARPFELPQFALTAITASPCNNITDEDEFSCIQADFHLQRLVGYYLIQLYIPSVLIVALSWVSFWLTIEAVPARISLGILTVLTMTTQKSVGVSLPKVSYVKAIDVWMAICQIFVFAALLEFALVSVLSRREIKRARSQRLQAAETGTADRTKTISVLPPRERNHSAKWMKDPLGKKRARTLDKISRILFPVGYILFCGCYWLYYTQI